MAESGRRTRCALCVSAQIVQAAARMLMRESGATELLVTGEAGGSLLPVDTLEPQVGAFGICLGMNGDTSKA